MRMKDLFAKVSTYNEVADLLNTGYHAKICFVLDADSSTFNDFKEFKQYFQQEVIDEVADFVLHSDEFDFNVPVEYSWTDRFGDTHQTYLCPELTYSE